MFAKLFSSLYQGTLRGRAHEILVFTNLLAHCDAEGYVDKHFRAVSEEVGLTIDEVKAAIAVLESPDPESRSPELDGRRIVRADEHRAWGWRVVNYGKYRAIRDAADRREQNRIAQAEWRSRNRPSASVSTSKQRKPKEREREKEKDRDQSVGGVVEDLGARPAHVASASPTPARALVAVDVGQEPTKAKAAPPATVREPAICLPPTPPEYLEERTGLTNHPTIEQCRVHWEKHRQRTGEKFTDAEIDAAFRQFTASCDRDGNWMWGKRMVGDWRAAMHERMLDNRGKSRMGPGPAGKPGLTAIEAIERDIAAAERRVGNIDP